MITGKNDLNIEEYTNLVKGIAVKYVHLGIPLEDLQQEGMMGLLEAKERFDETRDVAFSTYATFWVKKRIMDCINREIQASKDTISYNEALDTEAHNPISSNMEVPENTENPIVIPEDFPEEERTVLNLHFNEEKTLNEIADTMNISRERVRRLKQKALRRMRAKSEK